MKRGAAVEEDDAVGEGFGGEEFEADGADGLAPQGRRERRKQKLEIGRRGARGPRLPFFHCSGYF